MTLNHCRDSGTTAPQGGSQGGSRRAATARTTCPTCGKRVRVTRDGRLWPHGTRSTRKAAPEVSPEPPRTAGFRAAQEELVTQLRELTADRPAHASYLSALLAAPDLEDLMEVDVPRGVSGRYADALLDDVYDARQPPPPAGVSVAVFGRRYRKQRQADSTAAQKRERTRNSLEAAFRL